MAAIKYAISQSIQAKPKVKICGITRIEDALAAITLGADALGFVFYKPSPRFITIDQATAIIKQLPPFVTSVGLFVNTSIDEITDIVHQTNIDCIQLHGDESPQFCIKVQELLTRPVIKAIRVTDEGKFLPDHPKYYHQLRAILLDTFSTKAAGGTGERFNWQYVPALSTPVILAGGLTANNVIQAIEQVTPYAVDVSGGVEMDNQKGIKDFNKMAQFIQQIKC